MAFATETSQNVGDEIQIKRGSITLTGVVSKVTDKAVEITTDSTRGELSGRVYAAKVWFPKKAIVALAAPKDATIAAYYKANRMYEGVVGLASWFKLDERQLKLFNASA